MSPPYVGVGLPGGAMGSGGRGRFRRYLENFRAQEWRRERDTSLTKKGGAPGGHRFPFLVLRPKRHYYNALNALNPLIPVNPVNRVNRLNPLNPVNALNRLKPVNALNRVIAVNAVNGSKGKVWLWLWLNLTLEALFGFGKILFGVNIYLGKASRDNYVVYPPNVGVGVLGGGRGWEGRVRIPP